MKLKVITLELARNPDQPLGDPAHGYLFRAPLDEKGHFDRFRWAAAKTFCTVRRIEKGEVVEKGLLILNRRGKWVFSYAAGDDDDETVFRLDHHRFTPGEYVSITEHDGVQRTFRVASVANWHLNRSEAPQATAAR